MILAKILFGEAVTFTAFHQTILSSSPNIIFPLLQITGLLIINYIVPVNRLAPKAQWFNRTNIYVRLCACRLEEGQILLHRLTLSLLEERLCILTLGLNLTINHQFSSGPQLLQGNWEVRGSCIISENESLPEFLLWYLNDSSCHLALQLFTNQSYFFLESQLAGSY